MSADCNGSSRLFQFSICHLWSQGTFPDQVIQTFFLRSSLNGFIRHISRTDSFMRFLSTLRFRCKMTRMHIFFTHQWKDGIAARTQCQIRQVYRVGTHISNLSVLIQPLCQHHGLCHGIAQLTRSFLLQGRSCKRSSGWFLYRTSNNIFYFESSILATFQKCLCLLLGFKALS